MLRPSDVADLAANRGSGPAVAEWPVDLVAFVAEQARQLEAAQAELAPVTDGTACSPVHGLR